MGVKLNVLATLGIVRIAHLTIQHRVRCSPADSDLMKLLRLSQQERCLLRVEHLIRKQNMIDAYTMIESYILLLIERVSLVQENKGCPDELKEAISSWLFAPSRCSEVPELQEICRLFVSRFSKELANRAAEIGNNCGVNPKIVRKLSTQSLSLESKLKTLDEITVRNGISHQSDRIFANYFRCKEPNTEKKNQLAVSVKPYKQPEKDRDRINESVSLELDRCDETFYEKIMEARKKYNDKRIGAQEAYELASGAAAAARAVVELSLAPSATKSLIART